MQRIAMGLTASDILTGFTGVVTGYCQYITGCDQYLLTPKGKDKNKKDESEWFDDNRLIFNSKIKRLILKTNKYDLYANGPMDAAPVK